MDEKWPLELFRNEYMHLAEVFSKIFISVVELDLSTGAAIALKSSDTEVVMKKMPWSALLRRYAELRSCREDRAIIMDEFSLNQLQYLIESGQKNKSIEVRCGTENGNFEWMELSAMLISNDEKKMLVTTRNINEQRLLKSIVDRFVYKNCDYFILLDTKNNSFVRFVGSDNGTDLPPIICNNYEGILKEYNDKNVMPYDADRVTAQMTISNIIKVLEYQDEHCFYCDAHPEHDIVRRKRIQMVYHDKSKGLVLLTRTDVTDVYMQERALNEQLRAALIKSQTDSLTQLYNQAATADLISQKLIGSNCCAAMIMFVDVDNFKMVNDTLGHMKGDFLLKFVAQSLRELIQNNSIIGRIGGDEFLIFIQGEFTIKNIEFYAKEICGIFAPIQDDDIQRLNISCSVGISIYPQDGADYETLTRKADQALYDSKRYGKNKYCFYSQITEREHYESMISKIDK